MRAFEPEQVIVEFIAAFNAGGKLSLSSVVSIRDGDLALTHTKVRFGAPGQEPMEPAVGSAEIVRRQPDGSWRYVVDNFFGPAILDAMP